MIFPFFFEKKRTAKNFSVNQTCLYHEKMSHDEQPPLIWFQLVESDGQPYKGSSANSLSLNPSAVVDELRLAVVNKNPNILSSVDASQLKIYKNKTAFDTKEKTLEDDCLVSGLGLSDKEALVVLVPTPTVSILCPSSLNQNENGGSGD